VTTDVWHCFIDEAASEAWQVSFAMRPLQLLLPK